MEDGGVEQFMGMHMTKTGCKSFTAKLHSLMEVFPELDAVQIFTHNPKSFNMSKFDPTLAETAEMYGVTIHVHGSYMCLPWKGGKFLVTTVENFEVAHRYGAKCVVLHMPKATPGEIVEGIKPLAAVLRKRKLNPFIMLEMKALKYDKKTSMTLPDQINALTDAIFEAKLEDQVRICIDTAHIDAGKAPIKTYSRTKKYLKALDSRLIGLIHLNGNGYDSSVRAGDKHEVPLSSVDKIWGVNDNHSQKPKKYVATGCKAIVDYAMVNGIDLILEIRDTHSVESIREFLDKIC
jgi:endonuclease IV